MSCVSNIRIATALMLIGSVSPLDASEPLRGEYSFQDIQTKPSVRRGELDALMGISTFPPRPYPWKKSFEINTSLTFSGLPITIYEKELSPKHYDVMIPWDFAVRSYGMSFGPRYEVYDEGRLREHIAAIHAQKMRALPYLSAYFYHSRDPAEYVGELKRWKP